jgi:hypothetical protein
VTVFLTTASLEPIHERTVSNNLDKLYQPSSTYLDFFYSSKDAKEFVDPS